MIGRELIEKVLTVALVWLPVLVLISLLVLARSQRRLPWARQRRGGSIMLNPHVYHQLHLVDVPRPAGSVRIDHVVVSRFGIFAVATTTMTGWIRGAPTQRQWTCERYRVRTRFENPLLQLGQYSRALAAALQIGADHVHPVVSFVGDTAFKTEMPPNVTRGIGLVDHIRSFQTPVFTEADVRVLEERISRQELTAAPKPSLSAAAPLLAEAIPGPTSAPARRGATDPPQQCPHRGVPRSASNGPAPRESGPS